MARKFHPDVSKEFSDGKKFREVRDAYLRLKELLNNAHNHSAKSASPPPKHNETEKYQTTTKRARDESTFDVNDWILETNKITIEDPSSKSNRFKEFRSREFQRVIFSNFFHARTRISWF